MTAYDGEACADPQHLRDARTYPAFPGTPPASGSGSPRRTWPLRTPAALEAAAWAAS